MNQKTMVEEIMNGLNMGMLSIDHLLDKIDNEKLRNMVMHQRKSYGELKNTVRHAYPDAQDKTKQKLMLESMVEMKSFIADDAKIAKMLMEGANQAIMTITHLQNESTHISSQLQKYCDDFLNINQQYIQELKAYI